MHDTVEIKNNKRLQGDKISKTRNPIEGGQQGLGKTQKRPNRHGEQTLSTTKEL